MATSEQLLSLVSGHFEGSDKKFMSALRRIAEHEIKVGHEALGKHLLALAAKAQKPKSVKKQREYEVPPAFLPTGELSSVLSFSFRKTVMDDMVFRPDISQRMERIIREQDHLEKLRKHGLTPRRKFLLMGPPGTGKTMTASALAGELDIPLFVTRLEGVLTKFMGEASAKLRVIFESMKRHRGVYLFDEFDSIGASRVNTNDVGEMRRTLNSFLQFMDEDTSDSILLAATNHPQILDYALNRRFDDAIRYALPTQEERHHLMQKTLKKISTKDIDYDEVAHISEGLSHAEVVLACEDALKEMIISDKEHISHGDLMFMIYERRSLL